VSLRAPSFGDREENDVHGPPDLPGLVFAFTGQGSQYPGMTSTLYAEHALYHRHLDEAAEALLPYVGTSVVDLILNGDEHIHKTKFAQPSLFAVEYALSAVLVESGIRPRAVIGHSIGEFAAAVVGGALGLRDAAALVAARGSAMQELPAGGGMLAVNAPAGDLADLLASEPDAAVGAFNGPRATVLSGGLPALERIAAALKGRVRISWLQVSHAFHSHLMEPMLAGYADVAGSVRPGACELAFYSTLHGRLLGDGESLDADYWVEHIASPVRFAQAAGKLLAREQPATVVEIGPKPVLTGLLRRMPGANAFCFEPACRGEETRAEDLAALVGRLRDGEFAGVGASAAGVGPGRLDQGP
jgi:acyl transferase domain-containing protein